MTKLLLGQDARGCGVVLLEERKKKPFVAFARAQAFYWSPEGDVHTSPAIFARKDMAPNAESIVLTKAAHWLNDQAWGVCRSMGGPLVAVKPIAMDDDGLNEASAALLDMGLRAPEFINHLKNEVQWFAGMFDSVFTTMAKIQVE